MFAFHTECTSGLRGRRRSIIGLNAEIVYRLQAMMAPDEAPNETPNPAVDELSEGHEIVLKLAFPRRESRFYPGGVAAGDKVRRPPVEGRAALRPMPASRHRSADS
jgi:hypothetical protein